MGYLSKKLANSYGIDRKEPKKELTKEQEEVRRVYGERVKNYKKPIFKLKEPVYGNLIKLWYHYAKEITKSVGKELKIDEENEKFIKGLLHYFSNDEENFKKYMVGMCKNEPSIKKGLFIAGSYGCGKTLTMIAMQKAMQNHNGAFSYKSTVEIVANLDKNQEIDYTNRTYFFDDLGQEKKHYGNEVFSDLLFQRYDLFRNKGKKTFLTSNLNMDQIEDRYGQYISSRFYEMFNIIYVKGTDRRKN